MASPSLADNSITETPTIRRAHLNQNNIREKENLKIEVIPELKQSIGNLFKIELLEFKTTCDKLVFSFYANSSIYSDKLEGEIRQKDQVINRLLVSLKKLNL